MNETDFIGWLLDAHTPSIRYLTMRRLQGRSETDHDVQAARREMASAGPIPTILAQQTETGRWRGERSYYTPKYTSTHWSMMLLAELAADDPRLQRGADFMLTDTRAELDRALAEGKHGLSCFWGNILRYVIHSGQAGDPRVQAVVRCIVHDAQEANWRCSHNGELPCAWGAARALWGLAALPAGHRTSAVEAAIQSGLAFLLDTHQLVAADYPTSGRVHSMWGRLNFPLFYQADILFVLRVVAELGALDHPGAQPALEWLAGRRKANGRWRGASPYRQRTWENLADREETDRWVSLHAAAVLKQRQN